MICNQLQLANHFDLWMFFSVPGCYQEGTFSKTLMNLLHFSPLFRFFKDERASYVSVTWQQNFPWAMNHPTSQPALSRHQNMELTTRVVLFWSLSRLGRAIKMRWHWVCVINWGDARFPSPTQSRFMWLDLDQVSLSAQLVQLLFVADSVPRSTFLQLGCCHESKGSKDLCCENCHSSTCQSLKGKAVKQPAKGHGGGTGRFRFGCEEGKTKINWSHHEFRWILGEWDGFLFKLNL